MFWGWRKSYRVINSKKRLGGGGTGKSITLLEWIKLFYIEHLGQGYKMHEIDQMDIFRYLDLTNFKAEKTYWENQKKGIAALKGA